MEQNKTLRKIEGVLLTTLKQIPDDRGSVLHMLRNDDVTFTAFGEVYFSEVFPRAIKAWKYHYKQTQNLAVPVGCLRIVIYDDRETSSTKGNIQIIDLGRPDSYLRLTIPPRLWYGFTCISDVPALLANCADITHNPDESVVKPINDISIPYQW